MFIAFEGGDGAGKSTQLQALVSWLRTQGREVVATREPGGTELGCTIRDLLLHGGEVAARAEALLFAADRAQHVATLVRPALQRGAVVVTDRYIDSSVAYQGAGRALAPQEILDLSHWATRGLVPDLTVLLDVDPDTGRARRSGDDRMEAAGGEFHARVRAHFVSLAQAHPQRYLVLDAGAAPESIAQAVRERVQELLGKRSGAGAEQSPGGPGMP
ncbi:dTMP kinase [Gephyromycinifex aptenodytis]|uniref:dTMP kinase n=1 Tax=Gephyromycinifex aptenodytis TaxID=2716227 RepID=UPI001B2FF0BD|nr:dTMP kinase [Gephyromycinifex aptenodytis]